MTLDEAMAWADAPSEDYDHFLCDDAGPVLAAEVRRLQSELEESDAVRDKCARLLAETAVALKGEEKALHRHGWHDLPKVAAIMRAEVTALRLYAPAKRADSVRDHGQSRRARSDHTGKSRQSHAQRRRYKGLPGGDG